MMIYLKLFIGSLFSIFLVLFSWKILYSYNSLALIFPSIILIVISSSLIGKKMQERRCFKSCYFKETSFFSKLLSSKIMVSIFYILISILMTITLSYSIIDYDFELLIYFIFHIILVILIFSFLNNFLKYTIHQKFLHILSREITIKISSLILFSVYIYLFLNSYEPLYLKDTLVDTLKSASNRLHSNSDIIDYILRLKVELDSWFWWLTGKSSEINNQIVRTSIWMIFVLVNVLGVLGVNRFIVQIIYLLNILFNKRSLNED